MDENYSVAQFQRTMNPAYRASSPQPSVFESHHDPNNPLAREMGLGGSNPVPQDHIDVQARRTPQELQPQHTGGRGPQPDPRLIQAQQQAAQQYQQSEVPHNDYPMDGMTQFCRIGAPSERSSNPSPVRPSSRDSQSDYSNPTSFSSIEPPSGSASPGKPMAPIPQPLEEQPKKRGFFQNHSPFRRKSKHDIEPPSGSITPSSRNTWGPASGRQNENVSPTRHGKGARGTILGDGHSASPEPVDPRANFQLNIGNNVFDVASPDARKQSRRPKEEPQEDLDPIAQALAELKGVTKQSSLRVSADRYHGLATPQPPGTPGVGAGLPGGMPTPLTNVTLNAAQRGTPPPSYDQPPSLLGAPKPAHTSRAMQQTTQRYMKQNADMYGGSASRPTTRGNDVPRAASPAPPRATSPRPGMYQAQPQSPIDPYRSASPNPYAAQTTGRSRANTAASPAKSPYGVPTGRGSYGANSRHGSPGHANVQRAVSPQPGYANTRPGSRAAPVSRAASPNPQFRQSYDRPSSSRGSDMALQIAPGPGSERGDSSVYGGSQRGRGGASGGQRPQSAYYGGSGGSDMGYGNGGGSQLSTKVRSKSVAEPRQYTKDGRMVLHYGKLIPFSLSRKPQR